MHDIVQFARSKGILCQGRGSAANSVACYLLGITEVPPESITLIFERFISKERGEPPDIDVDFEHERREEVIQWIYERYGRHRAGLTAVVIHFRSRAAIREVGKVIYSSADTPEEEGRRELESFDRELMAKSPPSLREGASPEALGRYLPPTDRVAYVDDFELVAFDEELKRGALAKT